MGTLANHTTMTNPATYPWQTAYVLAILELDPSRILIRANEAVRIIQDRLKRPLELDSPEHQAIEDAQAGIAVLKARVAGRPVNRSCLLLKERPSNDLALSPWRTAYASAVLERDQALIPNLIDDALRAIEETLRSSIGVETIEGKSLVAARDALGILNIERKDRLVHRL
jgi:hypothetical protein